MADELPYVVLEINSAPGENVLDMVRRLGLGGSVVGESDAQAALHYSQYIIANFDNSDLAAVLAASAIAQEHGSIWATPFGSAAASAPGSPTEGQKYIDTGTGKGRIYTSGAWVDYTPVDAQRARLQNGVDYSYFNSTWQPGFLFLGDVEDDAAGYGAVVAGFFTSAVGATAELIFKNSAADRNVVGFENEDSAGYSAICFRSGSVEHMAIGIGGDDVASPVFRHPYIEFSNFADEVTAPPDGSIVQTGYVTNLAGFNHHERARFEGATTRIGFGRLDQTAVLSPGFGMFQVVFPNSGPASIGITEEGKGTFLLGFPENSGTFVMGGGDLLTIRSAPGADMDGGAELFRMDMATGNAMFKCVDAYGLITIGRNNRITVDGDDGYLAIGAGTVDDDAHSARIVLSGKNRTTYGGGLELHAASAGDMQYIPMYAGGAERFEVGATIKINADNTALKAISYGANDSGGSGYKVLRVPN